MRLKKILSVFLCLPAVLAATSLSALAADTVTADTQTAVKCFETCENGVWSELNLPVYKLAVTGRNQYAYALSLSGTDPSSTAYVTGAPLSDALSSSARRGIETILMNGYPCVYPDTGTLTVSQAVQGTQAAILFWMAEQGGSGIPAALNRRTSPNLLRAKAGYEAVLSYADTLLSAARNNTRPEHSITVSDGNPVLRKQADGSYSGSFDIRLRNLANYSLATSGMPATVTISGSTAVSDCTVTVDAPAVTSGTVFTVELTGYDSRDTSNFSLCKPVSGSSRQLVYNERLPLPVCSVSLTVTIPGTGRIRIYEADEDGSAVTGSKWNVYTDRACSDLLTTVTQTANGYVNTPYYDSGSVLYIRQASTKEPFVLDPEVHAVTVVNDVTTPLRITAKKATGKIRITCAGDHISALRESATEYGTLYTPVRSDGGIPGAVFRILDTGGTETGTVSTGTDGTASMGGLPLGSYSVSAVSIPGVPDPDTTPVPVTIQYQGSSTAEVTEEVTVRSDRSFGTALLKKTTEEYDRNARLFRSVNGSGFVYGLYSAETGGIFPENALLEILTTGTDGTAESGSLPPGSYYFRELKVPDERVSLNGTSFPFTVSGGRCTDYADNPLFNDMHKGYISVYLTDSVTGAPVQGAKFEVRGKTDGFLYSDFETDATGNGISCALPVGEYLVKMMTPAPGYVLDPETSECVISTDTKSSIVLERTAEGTSVTLTKREASTGLPVEGARLSVTRPDGTEYALRHTDASGQVVLKNIPAGTYAFTETEAPSGYALSSLSPVFTVAEDGTVSGETELEDEPISLSVRIMNRYTGKNMGGLTVSLKDADGNSVFLKEDPAGFLIPANPETGTDVFLSPVSGTVDLRYLPAGRYTLEETLPSGYLSDAPLDFTLPATASVSDPLQVTVSNVPTGLKILKVDAADGNPLPGAGFSIKRRSSGTGYTALTFRRMEDGSYTPDSGGTETTLMVSGTGELFFTGLPEGDLWIEETVTPDGYFPISSVRITLNENATALDPYVMTIQNSKFIKLGMDSDWWEFPALCLGLLLLAAAAVILILRRKRKKKPELPIP